MHCPYDILLIDQYDFLHILIYQNYLHKKSAGDGMYSMVDSEDSVSADNNKMTQVTSADVTCCFHRINLRSVVAQAVSLLSRYSCPYARRGLGKESKKAEDGRRA